MITRELERQAQAWRKQQRMRETAIALGFALIVFALALVFTSHSARFPISVVVALGAFIVTLTARWFIGRRAQVDAAQLARHLDRIYPALEESSALWLRQPEELSVVEKMQLVRLDRAFTQLPQSDRSPAAPPSHAWRAAMRWLVTGGLAAALAVAWTLAWNNISIPAAGSSSPASAAAAAPAVTTAAPSGHPKIGSAEIWVHPPAYTRRPERHETSLKAEVEEGSRLNWQIAIVGDVADVSLRFGEGGRDELPMRTVGNGLFEATRIVTESTLYAVTAKLPDGTRWMPADVYAIKVIKDRPPTLRFIEPAVSRTEIPTSASGASAKLPTVEVRVAATDDYGLVEAHLVATVAKGSGEAVKFREQVIAFDPSPNATGEPPNTYEFTRTLDLAALRLEPGDELYFHVVARDGHEPSPNQARSETRFIVLKRPDGKAAGAGVGVTGVNLVPPYFRSQRQLIIDTEKLIADRPALTDTEFRERSNELGIDQQLLRLRYGQFLGEELEEGVVPRAGADADKPTEMSASGIPLDLMHQHDRAPEGADAAGSREATPASKGPSDVPLTPEKIIEPFVDQHDSQDEATFFDRPTKGSLRAALGAMWEAEGYLRTTRPAEALPAENRALEILKALQQSARAYVQRVGFEAAPLKIKERRLQGDLSSVARLERSLESLASADAGDRDVRATLREIWWDRTSGAMSAAEVEALHRVESRLAESATRDPADALAGLQALRRLAAGSADFSAELPALELALWRLLPPANALPNRVGESSPDLSRAYFQALQNGEATP